MTEEEWFKSSTPDPMIATFGRRAGNRKLRLFGCACCRRGWHLLTDKRSRAAIETAENFADGMATPQERIRAKREAAEAAAETDLCDILGEMVPNYLFIAAAAIVSQKTTVSVHSVPLYASRMIAWEGLDGQRRTLELADKFRQREVTERTAQANVCRHIFGNPFRPYPPLLHVSATVHQLAEVLYQQDTSVIAPLHDALLDAGFTDLAEHFRDPAEWHPKGCWALDLVLGKK